MLTAQPERGEEERGREAQRSLGLLSLGGCKQATGLGLQAEWRAGARSLFLATGGREAHLNVRRPELVR